MQKSSQTYTFIKIRVLYPFLTFLALYQHEKSAKFIHSFIQLPCDQEGHITISGQTRLNIFPSTFNFWYQHVKKQTISLLCSRDIFDLKSSSLIDQHHFGSIKKKKKLTDLLILPLAKIMIRWKKTKNGFYHHGQILAWR